MLSNPRLLKWTAIGVAAVVVLVALALRFQSAGTGAVQPQTLDKTAEPLDKARGMLQQADDLATCRSALELVNSHFDRHPDLVLPILLPSVREELRQQLALTEADLDEIEHPSFTLFDGIHLEQAFLLRDAAYSLLPRPKPGTRRKPEEEAAALFDWVMRQVRIDSFPDIELDAVKPQVAPQLGLRRGIIPPLGRALLFLGLVEQMGHDACLLSFPIQPNKPPRYWACGVLGSGNRIYLFDPRLGLPLPGPNDEGVATLESLTVKDSPVLRPLDLGEGGRYDVTPEMAAAAELHLTPSLSALAPRMRYLEKEGLVQGGKLAADPAASAERFRVALKAIGHTGIVKPAGWAVRVQRDFFPEQEGGTDTKYRVEMFRGAISLENSQPLAQTLRTFLPARYLPRDGQPAEPPLDHVFHHYAKRIFDFYFGAEQPRDQVLRGKLSDAARALGPIAGVMVLQRNGYLINLDKTALSNWFIEASKAHTLPGEPAEARSRAAQQVWRRYETPLAVLIQGTSAEELLIHVAYLQALVKHEQAARLQLRLGPAAKQEELVEADRTWKDALRWWKEFLYQPQRPEFSRAARYLQARAQHRAAELAALLAARAEPSDRPAKEEQARNTKQAAIALWQDLAGERKDLEALACRIEVRRLQKK